MYTEYPRQMTCNCHNYTIMTTTLIMAYSSVFPSSGSWLTQPTIFSRSEWLLLWNLFLHLLRPFFSFFVFKKNPISPWDRIQHQNIYLWVPNIWEVPVQVSHRSSSNADRLFNKLPFANFSMHCQHLLFHRINTPPNLE